MFRRQLSVAPFQVFNRATRQREAAGWHVVAMVLPGSDEMWVSRQHPAVFRERERAERFLAKVERGALNLSHWVGDDWACSPLRVDESRNPAFFSVL